MSPAPGTTFVKICGITRLGDARAAVRAGANALGFVFAPSPRRIGPAAARAIASRMHPSVATIGVFVDASPDRMIEVISQVGLDGVQLHGEPAPSTIGILRAARPGLFVILAVRLLDAGGLNDLASGPADAVMVDTKDPRHPAVRNGVVPADWIPESRPERLIVAGGLTPDNVAGVVTRLRPWGVDVSGGVEESPGRKDVRLVRKFVGAVRAAGGET